MSGERVLLLHIRRQHAFLLLGADNILVHAVQKGLLEGPPQHGFAIPRDTFRLRANHALVRGRLSQLLRAQVGALGIDNLRFAVGASLEVLSAHGSPLRVELFSSKMTLVEVADGSLEVSRRRGRLATLQNEGTQEDMVPPELPVVFDDNSVEPGHEESTDEEREACSRADNGTGELGVRQSDLVVATLPQQQHAEKTSGDTKVDRD